MPLISGWQLRTVQRLSGFDAGLRLKSHNVEDFRREELSSLASQVSQIRYSVLAIANTLGL